MTLPLAYVAAGPEVDRNIKTIRGYSAQIDSSRATPAVQAGMDPVKVVDRLSDVAGPPRAARTTLDRPGEETAVSPDRVS